VLVFLYHSGAHRNHPLKVITHNDDFVNLYDGIEYHNISLTTHDTQLIYLSVLLSMLAPNLCIAVVAITYFTVPLSLIDTSMMAPNIFFPVAHLYDGTIPYSYSYLLWKLILHNSNLYDDNITFDSL
jgi:hypothetical protein